MAVIDHKVGAVAITNIATLNKLNDTHVGIWDLKIQGAKSVPDVEAFLYTTPGHESMIDGPDEREIVHEEHFMEGGKYRSIVKLFCGFKDKSGKEVWTVATGWLIRPDLLVTAGHCAFDWAHKLGPVQEVKAYIGYNGKASINKSHVQFRSVKRVATTSGWLTAENSRAADVAFMQLDRPFTGVESFKFADTAASGSREIGIVGYPADMRGPNKEPGACMYEMFLPTTWNLSESEWGMLEYRIDTFGGNSGCPVLRKDDMVAIGVHAYGGMKNAASVIGIYGNPFLDYVAAFDLKAHRVNIPGVAASANRIEYISIPSSKTPDINNDVVCTDRIGHFSIRDGFQGLHEGRIDRTQRCNGQSNEFSNLYMNGDSDDRFNWSGMNELSLNSMRSGHRACRLSPGQQQHMSEENFLESVRKAVALTAPIRGTTINMGLPIAFGPLGAIVGALSNIAMTTAATVAQESTETGHLAREPLSSEEITHRAILAEAVLQAMLKTDNQVLQEEGFLNDVKNALAKLMPAATSVGPAVLMGVQCDIMQMVLEQLGTNDRRGSEASSFDLPTPPSGYSRKSFRAQNKHFANTSGEESFMQHAQVAANNDQDGFQDDFAGGVKSFFKHHATRQVIVHGLPGGPLLDRLMDLESHSKESSLIDTTMAMPINRTHEAMVCRAMLSEAVLQAAMKAHHDVLQEEGFFVEICEAVGNIAPIVLKAAPGMMGSVCPVVGAMLQMNMKCESGMMIPSGMPGLRRKRSAMMVGRQHGAGTTFEAYVRSDVRSRN